MAKNFRDLTEAEILALAISLEEEDGRIYGDFAEGLKADFPATAEMLRQMRAEEDGHRHRLIELYRQKFGDHIPLIRRHDTEDAAQRRLFVLQIVQPGLAGLMDGSVSTLAPLFAAAFATHSTHDAFVVGVAASVGAGISMGFAEALSDDGSMTGRGHPWIRGVVCGVMTALGGLGHTMPYLIPDFWVATSFSIAVVVVELAAISWIRWRFMDTPLLSATFQVMLGGALVFAAGILIGSS